MNMVKLAKKTKLVYPDGKEAVYTYDDRNFLSSISANGSDTKYTYDTIGRLTSKAFPNGVTQAYSYFPGGYLESMVSSDKKGRLDKYLYSYDGGQISKINRERRDLNAVSGQYEYQYDSLGRLISSSLNGKPRSSYTYDAFGNRKSLSDGISRTDYSYDVLDRLSQVKEICNNTSVLKNYDYDGRGNQTREFVDGFLSKTYTYDATNMLTKVTDKTKGELENHYNGLGFRVATIRPEEKIEYLCDLSRDYYNLLERTINGETESFVYDDNVISMSKGGSNYYYLQDEIGSPMYLTGTDGYVASSYAFDDFGRDIDPLTGKVKKTRYSKAGNIIQPFAFTGYQEDEVSGLHFAQARYYDSNAGRFQSEDIVKEFMDSPLTMNRYGYCLGNPLLFIDLDGNMPAWLEGIYAHLAIEADMKRYAKDGYDVRSNVYIKGGGKDRTSSGNGFADVVMKKNGVYSVYEIKPISNDLEKIQDDELTSGQKQLAGYVFAINSTISTGGRIGKYGQTQRSERAIEGNKIIINRELVTEVGNYVIDLSYYSYGDGMIYYEINTIKREPEKKPVPHKSFVKAPSKKETQVYLRTISFLLGVQEISWGLQDYNMMPLVFLDDETGEGIVNDILAIRFFLKGTAWIIDGSWKIIYALTGCGE
ncbi:RHS repeat domain-containing protein [Butyrivibrio sp. INlla14]|uniref:RHS repeat domain-containing protein n=1 Tax=Butyrivibrio sp. INlla14 TaxID=1520808 RepID=UPI0008763EDE|nr:RHS repeat-associated core domain-containing protein [Butyrivibrio sp. INlla14]SCY40197.1 RHS repeat-associated core domain-containing protein [Butyrivibrio sp. INlla14]